MGRLKICEAFKAYIGLVLLTLPSFAYAHMIGIPTEWKIAAGIFVIVCLSAIVGIIVGIVKFIKFIIRKIKEEG